MRDLNYDLQNIFIPFHESHCGSLIAQVIHDGIMSLCISWLTEAYSNSRIVNQHYTDMGNSQFTSMNMHNCHMNPNTWLICLGASRAVHASSRNTWLCLANRSNYLDNNHNHNKLYTYIKTMHWCYSFKKYFAGFPCWYHASINCTFLCW